MTDRVVVVEADTVSKDFLAGEVTVHAVQDCSVTVRSGEILAIVGKSGSGKSTLCNLLSGLDRPTKGTVQLLGRDLEAYDETEMSRLRATRLGFVLQKDNLVPSLTLAENVAAPLIFGGAKPRQALRRAEEILAEVGLEHRVSAWPSVVSGGEAQRAAVARACVGEPAIVFADEPTGALDSENGRIVMGLFRKLVTQHNSAGVIVTHDLDLVGEADHVIRLVDGRISEERVGA
ncbi:ABC transporter ATP-binding protein [Nocardia sp. CDC159]|uniref:ABC transporter ATP-binding protein n=1 Tax=Nocardia pulmonis TaxID=2951408 RepID=A0A9X2E7W1_9NOCA|nr:MULTISPECIES: ABC transporter ATP-binding protein [Nocardia]MCM6773128.1 ABC transporter ATP-binding protein [Nocardia pulmonis]MCM6785569.1 ABC transporter ATP-binding protein [Nocardia sp. CDC159]